MAKTRPPYLIMPAPDTQCFQIFLETLAKKYPRQLILLFVDGAGNHQSDDLEVPGNIMLWRVVRTDVCGRIETATRPGFPSG
jgi:hypothetical protein